MKRKLAYMFFTLCMLLGVLIRWNIPVMAAEEAKDRPIKDGIYQIASKIDEGYCLDVFAELSMDDIDIILWTRNPNNNFMKFKFEYVGSGYYKITNVGSNKVLEAKSGSAGAALIQNGWDGNNRQKWKLWLDENGYFGFSPQASSSCRIKIKDNKVEDMASINIDSATGSNAQKWTIIPLEIPGQADITSFKSTKSQYASVYWKKIAIADGYQVQVAQNDKFTSGLSTAYTTGSSKSFSKLTGGKRYYARVRAYKQAGIKKYYGSWSDIPSVMVLKGKPIAKAKLSKVVSTSKKKVTIKWNSLKYVDKYIVQVSTKKDFSSHTIQRSCSKKTTKVSLGGLKSKKTYYVRVRGCRKVSGVNTYGSWSSVKKVKIK